MGYVQASSSTVTKCIVWYSW